MIAISACIGYVHTRASCNTDTARYLNGKLPNRLRAYWTRSPDKKAYHLVLPGDLKLGIADRHLAMVKILEDCQIEIQAIEELGKYMPKKKKVTAQRSLSNGRARHRWVRGVAFSMVQTAVAKYMEQQILDGVRRWAAVSRPLEKVRQS